MRAISLFAKGLFSLEETKNNEEEAITNYQKYNSNINIDDNEQNGGKL